MFLLTPHSLRYAFGYEANDTSANTFFWFMHSVTLTLHGMVCIQSYIQYRLLGYRMLIVNLGVKLCSSICLCMYAYMPSSIYCDR